MTKEDAIAYGRRVIDLGLNDETQVFCELAIEALEQQPNEDCISRKETIDALKQQAENMLCWSGRYTEQRKGILTAINIVSDLPSVAPQPKEEPQQKTGHWIKHKHNGKPYFKCSECLYFAPIEYSYCPGCGSYNGGTK